ncbi:MAG TPA: pyridoxal phosphate-dependent aminotransferase [Acidimicrobiales bacterium]|nr:pyridoxal phosphate-dependent aminotransferase [Acidimicrobiales bacterium]
MSDRVPYLASRLQGFGTTIFAEMSALAVETGSVNLGQGFPDTDGPPEVLEAAIDAIRSGQNQYPPGPGTAELRNAIAEHQRHWYGLDFDPDTEILVTAGATEAIASALLSLCEPGDEVIMFEPYYDSYAACIAMAGASHRLVQLRPPGYTFDPDAFRAAVTPRTRLVLINSPHNPTGKVLSRDELVTIAEVCIEHDLIAVTDEVYEHIVFDGEHIPLATLPGMRDRVVTISSGGKSFSCTGWKIGWVCARAPLVTAVRTAKQFLTYVNGGPFQHAIAVGLGLPDDRINALGIELREKRDRLTAGLASAGLTVYPSAGTYFVTVDIRSVGEHDGYAFCRSLPERCGVVAVPNVVFYDDVAAGSPLVRFAFCKKLEVIDDAVARLQKLTQ